MRDAAAEKKRKNKEQRKINEANRMAKAAKVTVKIPKKTALEKKEEALIRARRKVQKEAKLDQFIQEKQLTDMRKKKGLRVKLGEAYELVKFGTEMDLNKQYRLRKANVDYKKKE